MNIQRGIGGFGMRSMISGVLLLTAGVAHAQTGFHLS
jgi:hypothetical protein